MQQKRKLSPDGLRERVAELEETLQAIQAGEIDAVIVQSGKGPRVFTLESADRAFRMIVEQMGDGAATVDLSGCILYSNRRLAAILGSKKVTGSSILDFAAPSSAGEVRRLLKEAAKGSADGEVTLRRGDKEVPVYLNLTRLTAYETPTLTLTAADLTERRLTAELERTVARRTAALTRANTELEAFCYSVSHDLRAPLRGIDSFGHLLERSASAKLDDEERRMLYRIRMGTGRMAQIIDALLALSRTTQGGLKIEPLNMTEIAKAVAAEQAALSKTPVSFKAKPGVKGRGDARLTRVLIQNLLSNAWKFTAGRNPAKVEFGIIKRKGPMVYFVKDNGVGFDMEFAQKMFEPFQRLHAAQGFEGTGIGLALAQRIVARHGGKIWAEGAPEKGAVFFFTLGEDGAQ